MTAVYSYRDLTTFWTLLEVLYAHYLFSSSQHPHGLALLALVFFLLITLPVGIEYTQATHPSGKHVIGAGERTEPDCRGLRRERSKCSGELRPFLKKLGSEGEDRNRMIAAE